MAYRTIECGTIRVMSNSKKNWNASKANKRSIAATKQAVKIRVMEARDAQKRIGKGRG